MPVYTYQCETCGQRFDARQKFTDESITVCPECHGTTHKVIGSVGVVFKGSGFYVNDSKGNNPANEPTNKKNGQNANGDNGVKAEKVEKVEKAESASDSSAKADASSSKDTKASSATQASSD